MLGFGSTDGVLAAEDGSTDGVLVVAAGGSTDGALVVAEVDGSIDGKSLLDIFACPRKIIRLSGFYRLLWQRDKVTGLLLPSSAVGKNFVVGCAIHYPA
jgi:hypothetical protein